MEALRQQLLRIQQQLAALSPSQKMLTFTLVTIIAMTMFYWSKYAGTAEKVMLLDQAMTQEDISKITTELTAKNVSYVVQGDRIMVPTDKRFELLANLGYMQLLPQNMSAGFEDILAKYSSPFDNNQRSEAFLNSAKERMLAGMLVSWAPVKTAAVKIDSTRKLSPGKDLLPVASINIQTKSGVAPSSKLARAAADLVVGSTAGLKLENIKVLINNSSVPVSDPSEGEMGGENIILQRKTEYEDRIVTKILNAVHIDNSYATVCVDLNTKASITNSKEVDPKKTVKITIKTSTSTNDNEQRSGGGGQGGVDSNGNAVGEPGTSSNTSASIDGVGGSGSQRSTTEKNEIENMADYSHTETKTSMPAGDAVATTAAINVPEAYFIGWWKYKNPTKKTEPTADDIDAIIKERTPIIRDQVKKATGIQNDEAISVASYIDVSQPFNPTEATNNATLASIPSTMGFGAKEIAIGVLALVSLFMVSMMVKKSTPPGQVIIGPNGTIISGTPGGTGAVAGGAAGEQSPEVVRALQQITASADLAGEVGEGGLMLTGHEMTEDEMESKQVIEQVGTLVQADPDAAANLVKRWINRE